jgi:hypothetical protein
MNTTTQTTDERCAMLAHNAVYYAALHNDGEPSYIPSRRFCRDHIVSLANRIISLRTQQAAASRECEYCGEQNCERPICRRGLEIAEQQAAALGVGL